MTFNLPKYTTYILSFILLISISWANTLQAQNYSAKLVDSISISVRWMEVDKMNHLYLLEDEHTLSKYDAYGKRLYQFNENNLGEISSVDVQNPFYILVYYNDYTTVIILDRTLSEIRRQNLGDLGIDQILAIGIASDNNIWLFDNTSYTLKKIDAQNQILLESPDLTLETNQAIEPTRLIEYDNKIYLNSPQTGVFVFDQYANYFKTIPITNLNYFQLYENQLFFTQNNLFKSYNLFSFQIANIGLPITQKAIKQIAIAQNKLYLQYKNRVEIIALKEQEKK